MKLCFINCHCNIYDPGFQNFKLRKRCLHVTMKVEIASLCLNKQSKYSKLHTLGQMALYVAYLVLLKNWFYLFL